MAQMSRTTNISHTSVAHKIYPLQKPVNHDVSISPTATSVPSCQPMMGKKWQLFYLLIRSANLKDKNEKELLLKMLSLPKAVNNFLMVDSFFFNFGEKCHRSTRGLTFLRYFLFIIIFYSVCMVFALIANGHNKCV